MVGIISWWSVRKTDETSSDGYFLGGRSLTGVVIAGSMLLTNISTEHLIGMNGSSYKNGFIIIAWEVTSALALVAAAILVDGIALTAIILRLSEYGLSPNKLAALGENILLLLNLVGLLWLYIRYFNEKIDFEKIEIFQTSYLTCYAIWMGVVVFIFPIIFGFK